MSKPRKYFIKTFGCQQNKADSERIAAMLEARGMVVAKDIKKADHIVINTCMVRQSAEDRIYGLVNNLSKLKNENVRLKIILTGCLVGMAVRDKSGIMLVQLRQRLPVVDEFLPIEEVGFDHAPLRLNEKHAWVPISSGCNNFCTFCVVPFTRGREVSRAFADIMCEVKNLAEKGYEKITLLGMNVNSYGADLVKNSSGYRLSSGRIVKPILVKHLGRHRIPTLFPYLLDEICNIRGIKQVDFISSNPWDFSDKLIQIIKKNKKITRTIHLPIQSGNDDVLRLMNRWYTGDEYLGLVSKLRANIGGVKLTTDIIVGFPGESKKQFTDTVALCKKVGFEKAYIAMYSDRPMTAAHKFFEDNISYQEKKRRWQILEELINQYGHSN